MPQTLNESPAPLAGNSWSVATLVIIISPATSAVSGTYYMISKYIPTGCFPNFSTSSFFVIYCGLIF